MSAAHVPATSQHSICLILFHVAKACELPPFQGYVPIFSDPRKPKFPVDVIQLVSDRAGFDPGPPFTLQLSPHSCPCPPASTRIAPPRNIPVRREGLLRVKSWWLVILDPAGASCPRPMVSSGTGWWGGARLEVHGPCVHRAYGLGRAPSLLRPQFPCL